MEGRVVLNLSDRRERVYLGCTPEEAVIAAYAQAECNDWNAWGYKKKYSKMLSYGNYSVTCGDWCTLLDERRQLNEIRK